MSLNSHVPSLLGAIALLNAAWIATPDALAQNYTVNVLSSDGSTTAPNSDPNLTNPWGLSRSSGSPWWVTDNHAGKSTLYNALGGAQSLVVTIPTGAGSGIGSPTGTIFNGGVGFALAPNAPAVFLFATEDGTISGWNPTVSLGAAKIMVNNPGAVYKGLTSATRFGSEYLYVTNFNSGKVEAYDSSFNPVLLAPNAFKCTAQEFGLVPFNIQNIGGTLWVTFAQQDAAKHDNVNGDGLGFVASFTPSGRLIKEMEFVPSLNAPWGLALAPSDFGSFSHQLLVGQFGSGQILVFSPENGRFEGVLEDPNNAPITFPGLWAISFGAATTNNGNFNALYFVAGPANESQGLFGSIAPVGKTLIQGNGN